MLEILILNLAFQFLIFICERIWLPFPEIPATSAMEGKNFRFV